MKRHLKWAALPLILIFTLGATVEPGLKIWQYPNRPVPSDTAFFVLSEGGVTYNVSAFQLRSKMTQGLATVTYVNSATNGLGGVSSNYVVEAVTSRVFVAAGSTNVGIVTNYGANGTVTYTVYATNDGSGTSIPSTASNAVTGVWTNDVNLATPATNINFWFTSTTGVNGTNRNGLVDITFTTLSGGIITNLLNTASNALWLLTTTLLTNYDNTLSNNLYTNLLAQINTASNFLYTNLITAAQVGLRTNQWTTNIDDTPVVGQLNMSGTNGFIGTIGQRESALERNPMTRSLRHGQIGNVGVFSHVTIRDSNFWDTANVGLITVGFGSNVLVKGDYSTVSGGALNTIYTNATHSFIGGGLNNSIHTNATHSAVPGGQNNVIRVNGHHSTIGGGSGNLIASTANDGSYNVIAGGNANTIQGDESVIAGGNGNTITRSGTSGRIVIGGGYNNNNDSAGSTIAGGWQNDIDASGDYATIGGGRTNVIGDSGAGAQYSTIGGGSGNKIKGQGGATGHATISGGKDNYTEGGGNFHTIAGGMFNRIHSANVDANFISGGVSNRTAGAYIAAIGWFITNAGTKTIEMGFGNDNKITINTNGVDFRGITNLVAGTITNLHRYVGRVRLANGQSTYFITNNLAGPNTIVTATLNSNCGTTLSNAVPTAGLITIQTVSAVTADADISFQILTP